MFLSELEAKSKVCHLITYCTNERQALVKEEPPHYRHSNCLGSACMAWRWLRVTERLSTTSVTERTVGYCGMVGKPDPYGPFRYEEK